MLIEAAQAERPRPGNNHDRPVMLERLGRFALFDGAGQAMASDVAAEVFTDSHRLYEPSPLLPFPLLNDIFEDIQSSILRFQREEVPRHFRSRARYIRTTGTALGIRQLTGHDSTPILEYAHAGDSSLRMFDYDAGNLSKLTRDEILGTDPDNCVPDIRNWLGSPTHQLRQWLGIPLRARRAVFALFSDGVSSYESHKGAISDPELEEILKSDNSAQDKADQVIEASSIKDDASIIVVEFAA